jgi:hypothetical protein
MLHYISNTGPFHWPFFVTPARHGNGNNTKHLKQNRLCLRVSAQLKASVCSTRTRSCTVPSFQVPYPTLQSDREAFIFGSKIVVHVLEVIPSKINISREYWPKFRSFWFV